MDRDTFFKLQLFQYPAQGTFELSAADSGSEAAPVVYRAEKKGSAVLYGGKRLGGFVLVTDPAILRRLPSEVRGKVFECDLKRAGITNYSPLSERGYGVRPPASTLPGCAPDSPSFPASTSGGRAS